MPSPDHQEIERDEAWPSTLNRFRLLGQIAKGGMAEVFLARTEGLGGFARLLVIKRILPELARDADFVQMFLDEARIAATLHHANIVQVYEVDIADGQVFYAMEHLHGQTVAAVLRQLSARAQRMPLGNAIAITAAVAAGLHYAHERCDSDGKPLSIVHRDVAPNNVILTYDGNTKLIDFGIAKAVNNLNHTRFGVFKGKLPYSSPEQSRCEPVDRRSDVYSLGVMLYELTVGTRLFTAENEYELLRIVSEAVIPRPSERDSSYPRELEAIVLKALAADPAERYPTARALQNDLEVFASQYRLDLSALSLARLLEGLFRDEVLRWRDAERAGMSLAQHITGALAIAGYLPADGKESALSAPRESTAGELPAPSRVGDPPASAIVPARRPRWRDSWLVRYAVRSVALGLVIGGLISAGALGALWWSEPLPLPRNAAAASRAPTPTPAHPASAASRDGATDSPGRAPAAVVVVNDPSSAQAGSAADPARDTAASTPSPAAPDAADLAREVSRAGARSAPMTAQTVASPSPPPATDLPASPAAALPDDSADRVTAPPPRRTKRSRPRAPHARSEMSGEPKSSHRPDETARPLDDATLDEVAPRSRRSR